MKPVKQSQPHLPDQGIYGDCLRAAYASLMELDLEQVPHFCDQDNPDWFNDLRSWLETEHGVRRITVNTDGSVSLDELLRWVCLNNPGVHYLLSGTSRNQVNHTVVCFNARIVHDPAMDDSGIIGPCDDGFYWIEWLGVLDPANA